MAITEKVQLGKDNRNDIILAADGSVPSLASVTKMTLTFEDGTVIDSSKDEGVFDWKTYKVTAAEAEKTYVAKEGDDKLVLKLGNSFSTTGLYHAELSAYDDENIDGIDWGWITFIVE